MAESTRRAFFQGVGALSTAVVIGFDRFGVLAAASSGKLVANPFVKILADNSVIVVAKHFEAGQGSATGLATLVAEELDADWPQVQVEWAPANAEIYGNLMIPGQGTGASTTIANSFEQYRQAGAAARDLLVRAAAAEWNVTADTITVVDGQVKSGNKSSGFGSLVATAATLQPSSNPALKPASAFKLIGNADLPRIDTAEKVNGKAVYASDVRLPNMVFVVVARSPRFGGKLKSFDAAKAAKINGVLDVKQIPSGVAVYASNTWAAIKGREALNLAWDFSAAEARSTETLVAEHRAALNRPGSIAVSRGNPASALRSATKTISADFTFPFLAHAPMEPATCVIQLTGDTVEIWDGCQSPTLVQSRVSKAIGIKFQNVKINTVYAGGSFGRRANLASDYVVEAAHAAKAVGGKWPIKLMWTREDDIKGGYYRPLYAHRIEAGIDASGNPVAWHHKIAGQSFAPRTDSQFCQLDLKIVRRLYERLSSTRCAYGPSVEGASIPYAVANLRVDSRTMESQIPVLWWRSVGHSHTAYAVEVVVDMLAELAGKDPVDYRLSILQDAPRHAGVLRLAAAKSDWGKPLPRGRARGVAVHKSFSTFVAQVVEVSKSNGDNKIKVERVVCAVDCGLAVNPDIVEAQMEGGIGFGLGAIMHNKITLDGGLVDQSNFNDYKSLRIAEMPEIEVHIVPSTAPPKGVGEPATPPIGPAVANAIYSLTGKRLMSLPLSDNDIAFAM